ncbi:hypothetical protein C3469_23940 [Mycobacterium kansasii]|nr:hypothetical protein C3479_24600 [Mycobacterium kansasii]POY22407.1 hypothetical protein C3469_23940 [Mycobacterium kansasii]POY30274.1 hypothetical protein C3478_22815 [Mycobacterium kansasii]
MHRPSRLRILTALLIAMLVGACSHGSPLGQPTPTGATVLGGTPMESAPAPPPGWKLQPVVPETQQQAQDALIGYLTKTLQNLPPGTTIDATRYSGGANTVPCKDVISGTPPLELSTVGDLKPPPGADVDAIIAKTGDIWKSWGWYVFERDGFYKPNRFGYSPDGYSLSIEATSRPGYPPTLGGVSPCFPPDVPNDRSPFPMILTA